MSRPERSDPEAFRWSPVDRRVFALLAAAILGSLPFLVHPWYDASGDASLYLSTAESLLRGEGYRYLGEPFVVRPPGFSLLLVPVLALRGFDFAALNAFVALWGAAAVLLLFAHLRPRLGAALAAATGLAVWLAPGFRELSTQILSDLPGLALLIGCLLLEAWASRRRSAAREIALGLAVGLACYVRAALFVLVPAIAVARLLRRSPSRAWPRAIALGAVLPALCAAAVLAPWAVRDAIVAPSGAVDQTRLHSYSTAMWHDDPADPESPPLGVRGIVRRVPLRGIQVLDGLGSRLQSHLKGGRLPDPRTLAAHLLVATLLLGCALRSLVRRRAPAELYVLGSCLLMSVYFGFGERLLLPVYVLSLGAAAETLGDLLARPLGPPGGRLAAAAAMLALAAADFQPRRGWDEIERKHREFTALAAALADRLPTEARLGSALGFNYGVYLRRPVYSLYPAIARAPDPSAAAEAAIARTGIDAVVLWPEVPRERELVEYFERRYGSGEPVGPARLWRLPPPGPTPASAAPESALP